MAGKASLNEIRALIALAKRDRLAAFDVINKAQKGYFSNSVFDLISERNKISGDPTKFHQLTEDIEELLQLNEEAGIRQATPNYSRQQDQLDTVAIQGSNIIAAGQGKTWFANTAGPNSDETYQWQCEGNIEGIAYGPQQPDANGGSKSFFINASPNCKSGTLLLSATGLKSDNSNSYEITVTGRKKTKKEDEQEPEGEDTDKKDDKEKAKDKKKNDGLFKKLFDKEKRGKLFDSFKKNFSKSAIKSFLKLYWPYILGVIVVIAIIIVVVITIMYFIGISQSGSNGSTPLQPASPISDKQVIKEIQIAAGNKTVAEEEINIKILPEIREGMFNLTESVKNPDAKFQADEINKRIDEYLLTDDPKLGKEIIELLKEFLSLISQQAPRINVKTRPPLDKIIGFNGELHYGTPLRKELPDKSYSGHGTYIEFGKGTSDASDLYTDKGSRVYAVFGGEIVEVSDDGTGNSKVVIRNGDYELLYANITDIQVRLGDKIDAGKIIGTVSFINETSQLHLELTYCGKAIITTLLDKINYDSGNKTQPWGQYLWENMKKILNLP